MSKVKLTLLVISVIIVIVAIIAGLQLQKRTVTITPSTTVELFSGEQRIATISERVELSLKDGEYCAVPTSERYSKDKRCFMVYKENKNVDLVIDYSKGELASRLDDEFSSISERVTTEYSEVINQYTICRGELLADGSWYGGILRDKVATLADSGNYYYFIAHKRDGWEIKTTPGVVISKHSPESEGIPERILSYVNTMTPCSPEIAPPENTPSNSVESFTPNNPNLIY